jgi:uncharacterized protein (TIGR02145 family)
MKTKKYILFGLLIICVAGLTSCSKDKDKDTPDNSVTDADGNKYNTVKIGIQTWTVENLKTTKYNDGTAIPNVTDGTAWKNLTTGAWCNYDNDAGNNITYGRLYNWYAVNTGKLCPKGWHIPTDAEWTALRTYMGTDAGIKLKAKGNLTDGTGLWLKNTSNNTEGINESGFTGLPGGYRNGRSGLVIGEFNDMSYAGFWWSSTVYDDNDEDRALYRFLVSNRSTGIEGDYYGVKTDGLSCRCIKD